MHKLRKWYVTGPLGLESAAAVVFIQEVQRIKDWTRLGIPMTSFLAPTGQAAEDMPGRVQEMPITAKEFRAAVAPNSEEDDSAAFLPKVPRTKQEVESFVKRQMGRGEVTVFRQLAQLGSMSSTIIAELQLPRAKIIGG